MNTKGRQDSADETNTYICEHASGASFVVWFYVTLCQNKSDVKLCYIRLYQVRLCQNMFEQIRSSQAILGYVKLLCYVRSEYITCDYVKLCQIMLNYVRLYQIKLDQVRPLDNGRVAQLILDQVRLCQIMLYLGRLTYIMIDYVRLHVTRIL